jgi:divalent metal cation (Fe/Co/Zn/Cd) transporter
MGESCCSKNQDGTSTCSSSKVQEEEFKTAGQIFAMETKWRHYALYLAIATIVWNFLEGLVSVYFGAESGSILLIAFGSDSFIEVLSACIVTWQLKNELNGISAERSLRYERFGATTVSVLLMALAVTATCGATYRLVMHQYPNTQIPALIISGVCLVGMYGLYIGKQKAAEIVNSATLKSDASCSLGCIHLSGVIFIGSLIFMAWKWLTGTDQLWFLSPLLTYFVAYSVGKEGYGIFKNAQSEDFDGTVSCCSAGNSCHGGSKNA